MIKSGGTDVILSSAEKKLISPDVQGIDSETHGTSVWHVFLKTKTEYVSKVKVTLLLVITEGWTTNIH